MVFTKHSRCNCTLRGEGIFGRVHYELLTCHCSSTDWENSHSCRTNSDSVCKLVRRRQKPSFRCSRTCSYCSRRQTCFVQATAVWKLRSSWDHSSYRQGKSSKRSGSSTPVRSTRGTFHPCPRRRETRPSAVRGRGQPVPSRLRNHVASEKKSNFIWREKGNTIVAEGLIESAVLVALRADERMHALHGHYVHWRVWIWASSHSVLKSCRHWQSLETGCKPP